MADPAFLSLPRGERIVLLTQAGDRSGRRLLLLEKDVWVVQSLEVLFSIHVVKQPVKAAPRGRVRA